MDILNAVDHNTKCVLFSAISQRDALALRAVSKLGKALVDPYLEINPLCVTIRPRTGPTECRDAEVSAILLAVSSWPRCRDLTLAAELPPGSCGSSLLTGAFQRFHTPSPHVRLVTLSIAADTGTSTDVSRGQSMELTLHRGGPQALWGPKSGYDAANADDADDDLDGDDAGAPPDGRPAANPLARAGPLHLALTRQLTSNLARLFPRLECLTLLGPWRLAPGPRHLDTSPAPITTRRAPLPRGQSPTAPRRCNSNGGDNDSGTRGEASGGPSGPCAASDAGRSSDSPLAHQHDPAALRGTCTTGVPRVGSDPDSPAAAPLAALGPGHLAFLTGLRIPADLCADLCAAAATCGVLGGHLTGLIHLALDVPPLTPSPPLVGAGRRQLATDPKVGDPRVTVAAAWPAIPTWPLPPDLPQLTRLRSLTLLGGQSDPAAWRPRLAALPALRRLSLRRHNAVLPPQPLQQRPVDKNEDLGLELDLDLDLAAATLAIGSALDPRGLVGCMRLCEGILKERDAAAAAAAAKRGSTATVTGGVQDCGDSGRGDAGAAAAAATAAAAAPQPAMGAGLGAGGSSALVEAPWDGSGGRLVAVSLRRLQVNPGGGASLVHLEFMMAFATQQLRSREEAAASGPSPADAALPPPWLLHPDRSRSDATRAAAAARLPPRSTPTQAGTTHSAAAAVTGVNTSTAGPGVAVPLSAPLDQPPGGGDGGGLGLGPRLAVSELRISWFEMASWVEQVLLLLRAAGGDDDVSVGGVDGGGGATGGCGRGGRLRLLELWCSRNSETLLRRLVRDLGGLPREALPQRVVVAWAAGAESECGLRMEMMEATLRHSLSVYPHLTGIVTARLEGGREG